MPLASCICLTFGRPHFVEEAIASFLRQDYPGDAELLVVNDFPGQRLVFEGDPRVRVLNYSHRFTSLGAKRNAAVVRARGDVILTWDDDDIALPGRIRRAVEFIGAGQSFYRPAWAWTSTNGAPPRLVFQKVAWPQCAFSAEVFRRARGYPRWPAGEDREFARRVEALGHATAFSPGGSEQATFLYRLWSANPHASGISLGRYDYAELHRRVSTTAPNGAIELHPTWKSDYEKLCQSEIATA